MKNKTEQGQCKTKKTLLYIGHDYHNKTKSTLFLKDLFRSQYEVEISDFNPYNDNAETAYNHLEGKSFDVLVLFQIMPDIERLKKLICFKHTVFFPMFDGSMGLPDEAWEGYRGVNIINFSRTLHKHLLDLGMSSYYIQYFPKPIDILDEGDSTRVFFWQRIAELNINVVEKLLTRFTISQIHIHKALDPNQDFIEPSTKIASKVEYSTWYDTREEMQKEIESCGIYIAPRLYEGIGMSFLEAMAMGRCVIAPDHPTMNEYIEHGETGLLYDFQMIAPVKAYNVKEIQRNTIEYIKNGFEQWEKEKYKIFDWLEAPVKESKVRSRKKRYIKEKHYYLFAFILLMVERSLPNKRYYDLFGFIRILKSKQKGSKIKFYLFGLIPVWKIK